MTARGQGSLVDLSTGVLMFDLEFSHSVFRCHLVTDVMHRLWIIMRLRCEFGGSNSDNEERHGIARYGSTDYTE